MERRRGRGAPAVAHRAGWDLAAPLFVAIVIEAEQADIAKQAPQPVAIDDRRLRGIAPLHMDRLRRLAFVECLLPADAPRLEVETEDLPTVDRLGGLRAIAAEVQPLLRLLDFPGRFAGGEEDLVAPDHRRRPPTPGDVGLPGDVLRRRPAVGKTAAEGHAPRGRATERRPISLLRMPLPGAAAKEESQGEKQAIHGWTPEGGDWRQERDRRRALRKDTSSPTTARR